MTVSAVSSYSQALGDVNNSGTIDIIDALLIAQYSIGSNPPGFISSVGDVNCSGSVDIIDALLTSQYSVGIIASFPCNSTPTPTMTPAVTIGPTNPPGELLVYYLCNSTGTVTNSIQAQFKIQNNSSKTINLANVKIRYWYTLFTGQAQSSQVYWADAGTSNAAITFTMMTNRTSSADCIMEISFGSGAGTLAAGASSQISVAWNKSDWSNNNQANDYSFNPSATSYSLNTKVTGYLNGSLAFGTEPSNPPPTITPTPTQAPVTPASTATMVPTVTPSPGLITNLAFNKNCTASSQYDTTTYLAVNSCDGNMSTRWSSSYSDPQWLSVDLGRTTTVKEVKIYWETAYASQYKLQISADSTKWTDIYTQNSGTGNIEDLTITNTTKGRYIRIGEMKRATEWGDSIWEFEVYGNQEGPSASFTTNNTTPVMNQIITYDASGSIASTGIISNYSWDFGDNTTGTGKTITHAYSSTGTYRTTLTITTDSGQQASIPKIINVYSPEPKVIFITNPKVPNAGQATVFDASSSWDADGTISSYSWNFGDGTSESGKIVTHNYSKDGFYSVKLTITDNDNRTASLTSNLVVDSSFAPPLHVNGNQIIDANNKPLILKGFAVYDPIYWQEKDIIHWKNDWKVNVVRLAFITDRLWYNTSAEKQDSYLKAADNVIKWCRENKIYVILDGFHEGGNTGDVAYHWPMVQNAWKILAPRYQNQDHIIWEIYNEPYKIEWTAWVPQAETLVDIIRSYNPIVKTCIVPGVNWAQDAFLDLNQVNRPQIIYSWHPYPHVYNQAWDATTWDVHFGYISKYGTAPVIADEWGWDDNDGNSASYGEPILKYFINSNINWTYWGMFPGWGSGNTFNLVSNNYTDPEVRTEGGNLVYDYLNGKWKP